MKNRIASLFSAFCFKLCPLLFALCTLSCDVVTDSNPVNDLKSLPVLSMYASNDDLNNLYNNRFTELNIPVKIGYDGKTYNAGIEASGAGSRYYPKYSFKVSLKDEYIKNLNEFNISAQVHDKTMIKTLLALYLYNATGFPVFSSEPVFVKMNDENLGLFSFIERVDEIFFRKQGIPLYELYQVKFDAKFTFSRKNNVKQNFEKELPDNENFENLESMINAVDNVSPENIFIELDKYIDVREYLMYHAITTVRHDPDAFTNNFFLYKETPSAPFRIIPWDFDKTFDIIGQVGFYGDNDLIEKLFQNDSCRVIYKNDMEYILNNIFTEVNLYPLIDELALKIKPYYKYDPYLGKNNFDDEIQFLKTFISKRRTYLLGELDKFN